MWRSELHCANEASNLVCRKRQDTKWQLLALGVWSLPADADGAAGAPGRSSCSEKAVESGTGETQDFG